MVTVLVAAYSDAKIALLSYAFQDTIQTTDTDRQHSKQLDSNCSEVIFSPYVVLLPVYGGWVPSIMISAEHPRIDYPLCFDSA